MSDLVGNPEDWFSQVADQMNLLSTGQVVRTPVFEVSYQVGHNLCNAAKGEGATWLQFQVEKKKYWVLKQHLKGYFMSLI